MSHAPKNFSKSFEKPLDNLLDLWYNKLSNPRGKRNGTEN
jgi:hypothetical protein